MLIIFIILLPFFSFLFTFLFGRFLGRKGSALFISFSLSFSLFIILFCFFKKTNQIFYVFLGNWFKIYELTVNWIFLLDNLSLFMLLLINFVGLSVIIFSEDYLKEDPYCIKFLSYISLFVFFMFFLVCSNNWIQLLLGWEGVGICSFLLISFWNTRLDALKASMKAIIVNRFSDCFLLLGILFIYKNFLSLDFNCIFPLVPYFLNLKINLFNITFNSIDITSFFLIVGAFGKSAQLFFHIWLPDAMEGPTPISALIHAATMVTLGVFLILRCSNLFEFSPIILKLVVILSTLTIFFTSIFGIFQQDIKKIIAFSTCSQLSYMFLACGISKYNLGFFHLFNHGFFKALLFLCAGNVIHSLNNEQDLRKMGGLKNFLPITYMFFLIGSLSITGFPFFSGYYSKDLIIENVLYSSNSFHIFSYTLAVFSTSLTSIYSYKLLYYAFLSKPNHNQINNNFKNLNKIKENNNFYLLLFLSFMFFFSLFLGYLFNSFFLESFSNFFLNSIYTNINKFNSSFFFEYQLTIFIKLLPFFLTILGYLFSFLLFSSFTLNLYNLIFFNKNIIIYNIIYLFIYNFYLNNIYKKMSLFFLKPFFNFFNLFINSGFLEVIIGPGFVSFINYFYNNIMERTFLKNIINLFLLFFLIYFYFIFFVLIF